MEATAQPKAIVHDYNTTNKVGVAVVGLGRMGSVHIENAFLNPKSRLLYIVDVITEKAKEHAARYPGVKPSDSYEEVLKDPEVDMVVICTPTPLHPRMILQAFEAGKHVFCEKPIAQQLEDIEECYDAAKKANKFLCCAFQRRYDPQFRRARNMLRSGAYGKIFDVRVCSRDHPLPNLAFLKTSGGFFHDCMSHDIDMARYLTGEDPTHVSATGSAFLKEVAEIGDVDVAVITLTFPSGAIATLQSSRCSTYGYDQRIEANTEKAMIQVGNPKPHIVVLSSVEGETQCAAPYSFPQRYVEAYAEELKAFVDMILDGRNPEEDDTMAKRKDAVAVCRIANLAEEARQQKKVIPIEW
ncbi:Oxidoreductase, C-terminal alpha/beta domain [Balamuthia mandrillaris]